ncbi:hypothetical protein [Acutalibacter intestini]|uniref:hypothetical protein n=1 Tax=Acutalibacter intestini TaxID=3093659 RepID=UPI002AC8C6CF|nr:hypothetical protein [Acutalibacter sp. M00204]
MYIMSQDGRTVGKYQLLTIKKIFGGKKEEQWGLYGYCPTGSADRALFSEPIIAQYPGEDRARQELEAVFAAIESGQSTYRLK